MEMIMFQVVADRHGCIECLYAESATQALVCANDLRTSMRSDPCPCGYDHALSVEIRERGDFVPELCAEIQAG